MKLFQDCWLALLELYDVLTISSMADRSGLLQSIQHSRFKLPSLSSGGGPEFTPPTHPEYRDNSIICNYTSMGSQWKPCSSHDHRGCWLQGPNGQVFDINTDYEKFAPKGVTRKYTLDVSNKTINADGVGNPEAKVFNGQYPGPWIQACWGDDIEITVKNRLRYNGTTIHWHGIRQNGTLEMDGVNGVTQCPIAPGDQFTYKFKATQYGTSWYHSHYSLQYGDGLLGPLTIHGPSSANWEEAKDPILMTDWNHRSGFQDFQIELTASPQTGPPSQTSILLNGKGSYAGGARGGRKYTTVFQRGKKYLLRLINTSVDTTFIFAIDQHKITVMSSDFVPIKPYDTDHVVVGIGQRYHVVVEALHADELPDRNEFWIRTIPADGCANFELGGQPDERQGILYYNENSTAYPTTARSASISVQCRDEDISQLKPIVPWTVPRPTNAQLAWDDFFEVSRYTPQPGFPRPTDRFGRWAIGRDSLRLKFDDPTIINLGNDSWDPNYVVVSRDAPEESWIYLVITSTMSKFNLPQEIRQFIPTAHPIHLHGHDFALLQQSNQSFTPSLFNPSYNNPTRRDVVLLPSAGFVVIAFKADNAGAWLLHCHIAMHASSGLALQMLENREIINKQLTPQRLSETYRVCRNWDKWFSNPKNYYNPEGGFEAFQDDSGI